MKNSIDNIIEIRKMYFIYGQRPVFTNITLMIPRGKIIAIIGQSGIGKTTLLRLIGGQLRPDKGEILFDGVNIPMLSNRELFSSRKKMSMLFQSGALFTNMNVFDNVAFPLREHTFLSEKIIRTLVVMKLEAVGLRREANLMPFELSGGMVRRAALARAIALDPQLILFDEPFVGQDPVTMGFVLKLIGELNRALGVTFVIVSHDVREVLSIADKVYIIAEQHVIAEGSPKELEKSRDEKIRKFLYGVEDGVIPSNFSIEKYIEDLLG